MTSSLQEQENTLKDVDLNEPVEEAREGNDKTRETQTSSLTSESSAEQAATGFSAKWTRTINKIRRPIYVFLHWITSKSARNPKRTVGLVVFLSVALLLIGLATNFTLDTDENILWVPRDSKPVQHRDWIDDHSGFPKEPRSFGLFFHAEGRDALGYDQVDRIFAVLDAVRDLEGYDEMCNESEYVNQNNQTTCRVLGFTKFWNHTTSLFQKETETSAITTMSASTFPDGTRATRDDIYGYPQPRYAEDGTLSFVMSYFLMIQFPDTDTAENFEEKAVDVVLEFDDAWQKDPEVDFRVEVSAYRSFEDEFTRAVVKDLPLVPLVFVIMAVFTMSVFFRKDRLYSRSFLGFCGVVSVLLSLVTGYGLMFVCGVPMTQMTQILPFVIFGIGLDDVFILTCSYDRTNRKKDPVERIYDTIEDVGLSITMTSLTSAMAFALGCLSTIPAIFWLCLYGFPTIAFVFLYQLTFFVACMVLDEERIQAGRKDCCCCRKVELTEDGEPSDRDTNKHFVDRLMGGYAKFLLRPWVKVVVTITFLAIAGACAYSASLLTQEFQAQDLLPDDSYLKDFFEAVGDYQARSGAVPFVYFRYVNQSNKEIQDQMNAYIDDLVGIDAILEKPDSFWLWDFEWFLSNSSSSIGDLEFNKQVDLFLSDVRFREMYGDHIVRDGNNTITASRCLIFMDNIDWDIVKDQIAALEDQRSVTARQPINQGRKDWAFFTYFDVYDIWELYRVSVQELIRTTIIGVFAVTAVALVLIPHWSAALFVFPFIVILYIDLLGFIQLAGLHINAVSYVGMVMSIGLLVDFIMHILLRYYESEGTRVEKTVNTLKTMGSSIFLGGVSSLLGTLPLAFSSSEIFFTVFIVFFGLVVLGVSHGLILLPVILSTCGPEDPPVNGKTHISETSSPDDQMVHETEEA